MIKILYQETWNNSISYRNKSTLSLKILSENVI